MKETSSDPDFSSVLDHSRFGGFQWGIALLCGLSLIMDGFDVQAMGYVAPALIRDWKIPNAQLGPVFSAALLGVLVGSLMFSMIADKIGRRPVLIAATSLFAVLTLATARATSIGELLAIRFIAGIALGGINPNATALAGEYSSKRLRVRVMMLVSNGFTAGAAFGGFIAAWLIPAYGWRSVFYFGGLVPFAIAVAMIFLLPESLQFLALKPRNESKIAGLLKRIDPRIGGDVSIEPAAEGEAGRGVPGVPIIRLFDEGRWLGTLMIWALYFLNLLNLYFLASWLPTVVRDAGYTTRIAVLVGTMVQVGGTLGSIALAWLVPKFGLLRVMTTCFLIACLSIASIGQPFLPLSLLFTSAFIAGWCVPGGQAGLIALSGTYYPTHLRATGIGSGLGVGRIGAIIGPLLAGVLMQRHWSSRDLFLAAAVPAFMAAVVMFLLRWVVSRPLLGSAVPGSGD